jgi:hypothetical protein
MTVWSAAGVLAGVLSLIDPVPYVRDILRGRTRPHRGTWAVWSMITVTALASQWAQGATWSLLLVAAQTAGTGVILVLSVRRGEGGLAPTDLALLGLAAIGIAGWITSARPVIATGCVVLADFAGAVMMTPKLWRDPHAETASSFVIAAVSGVLGAVAVGRPDLALLIYPLYFAAGNAVIAGLILHRRAQLAGRHPPGLREPG